jgi:16S rRNA (uracil1498-N3)-methyltransferase
LVERSARAPVATFYAPDLPAAPGEVSLGDAAAHHAGVRRLAEGDVVRVTSGSGLIGTGTIRRLAKRELVADVHRVDLIAAPASLELLAPVADRDRMLWLAEKCAELGLTVWQPVTFARSRSVTPRGEGEAFGVKVRARMIAALEQSAGAWLPEIRQELPLEAAIARVMTRTRYVLDRSGGRLDSTESRDGAAVIVGPEGGIEGAEQELLHATGWRRATLAPTTLRFETAGVAAVAILRAGATRVNAEE